MQTIEQSAGQQSYERDEAGPEQYANSNEVQAAGRAVTAEQAKSGRAPPPRPTRWIPQRKAEIVAAIRGGHMSFEEARDRYALSMEEYLSWQVGLELSGLAGLRVNRVQQNRHRRKRSTGR
jgi:hypothetical protein